MKKVTFFLFLSLLFFSCSLVKSKRSASSEDSYAYELRITGYWKKDSLIWHQKELQKKDIQFTFENVQTNPKGYLECLTFSVQFPDQVRGGGGNCSNVKTLQDFSYALGFTRKNRLFNKINIKAGFFALTSSP